MHINRHSFNGVDYVLESDCNAEINRMKAETEQLRVQLAGCGVAAMQNTESTIEDRVVDGDYGYSASYSDVCKAVDREIRYREALKAQLALVDSVGYPFRVPARKGENQWMNSI